MKGKHHNETALFITVLSIACIVVLEHFCIPDHALCFDSVIETLQVIRKSF